MELTTDYYAYEYAIIQKLNDIFNVKNVDFNKETVEAYGYSHDEFDNLQRVLLSKFEVDNYIQLNFEHKFHYCISRKSLVHAFQENCPADEVVIRLKKIIENEWLKLIYKD